MSDANGNPPLTNATPLPQKLLLAVNQPQAKILDKQIETNPPKKHIGGFNTHPENINRMGRPKRKTLTEYVMEQLDKKLPSGINGHENLARLILSMAFTKKDKDMIKEIWHYLDGMPTQKQELSGPNGGPIPILNGITHVPSNHGHKETT